MQISIIMSTQVKYVCSWVLHVIIMVVGWKQGGYPWIKLSSLFIHFRNTLKTSKFGCSTTIKTHITFVGNTLDMEHIAKRTIVDKIQGSWRRFRMFRGLLPLPSASKATSVSRGWLILGFTGVGDFPRRERSKPAHFSASAKNGSFLNTSEILAGHAPSWQVL